MNNIKCKECSNEYSPKMKNCPECGCPTEHNLLKKEKPYSDEKSRFKKIWVVVLGVLLIFSAALILYLNGGDNYTNLDLLSQQTTGRDSIDVQNYGKDDRTTPYLDDSFKPLKVNISESIITHLEDSFKYLNMKDNKIDALEWKYSEDGTLEDGRYYKRYSTTNTKRINDDVQFIFNDSNNLIEIRMNNNNLGCSKDKFYRNIGTMKYKYQAALNYTCWGVDMKEIQAFIEEQTKVIKYKKVGKFFNSAKLGNITCEMNVEVSKAGLLGRNVFSTVTLYYNNKDVESSQDIKNKELDKESDIELADYYNASPQEVIDKFGVPDKILDGEKDEYVNLGNLEETYEDYKYDYEYDGIDFSYMWHSIDLEKKGYTLFGIKIGEKRDAVNAKMSTYNVTDDGQESTCWDCENDAYLRVYFDSEGTANHISYFSEI